MTRDFEKELENPENWDFEKAEARERTKPRRVVVSVAFPSDDFQVVARAARGLGEKMSEFIRNAAIEKASGKTFPTMIHSSGNAGILWATAYLQDVTRVHNLEVERDTGEALVISS